VVYAHSRSHIQIDLLSIAPAPPRPCFGAYSRLEGESRSRVEMRLAIHALLPKGHVVDRCKRSYRQLVWNAL